MITVLCANSNSVYYSWPELDVWDAERNAYNFSGHNPVISHAPCAQWSRLRAFSKMNWEEKELAWFCLDAVEKNGGVFEHPAGSSFFRTAKLSRSKIYSVDQFWFGFPARKRTYLYFNKCKPLPFPVRFDAIGKKVNDLHSSKRSDTTKEFAQWLINCVSQV